MGSNSNLRVVELGALMDVRNANSYDAAFIWNIGHLAGAGRPEDQVD